MDRVLVCVVVGGGRGGGVAVASNHGVEVLGGPSTGNDGLVYPQYIQPRIEIAPDKVEIEIELPLQTLSPPNSSLYPIGFLKAASMKI